jgi:hypothetical protein
MEVERQYTTQEVEIEYALHRDRKACSYRKAPALNMRTTTSSPWHSNPHSAVKANGAQTFLPPPISRNPTSSSAIPTAGIDLQSTATIPE